MSWLGIVLAVIGLYLAFKVVKFVVKLFCWALVLIGAYWFFAPSLGLPSMEDLLLGAVTSAATSAVQEIGTSSDAASVDAAPADAAPADAAPAR